MLSCVAHGLRIISSNSPFVGWKAE
jgi:hypothetical protein